jgi:hypothetical protein
VDGYDGFLWFKPSEATMITSIPASVIEHDVEKKLAYNTNIMDNTLNIGSFVVVPT